MAQIISSVVGHKTQWLQVKKIISSDLQAGSFLFSGPEGIGKKKLALALIQFFLCETRSGCGQCGSCRRVEAETHEGLLVVNQEDDILKIEEAHKIKDFLKLKSLTNGRFILINNAHLMNISTSNALLKTLEEPPDGVFFILISSRISGLLMTIKSRCRLIPFSILEDTELEQVAVLNQFSLSNFRKSGQLHLVAKSQEKEFKPLVSLACDILDRLADGNFIALNDSQKATVKSKDQFLDLLTYLEIFVRDILLVQSGGREEIYFEDYTEDLQRWAKIGSMIWSDFYQSLGVKKEDLYLSPEASLFIESLIIDNKRNLTQ